MTLMAPQTSLHEDVLSPETCHFYRAAMEAFRTGGVPFLVGGAYAFGRYTGIVRHTKDFDVFVRHEDAGRALEVLSRAGFMTDLTFPHWLGKAYSGEDFVDVIFSSGNGVARVDEEWFEHAIASEVFGVPVKLCPVEEMIWSKAFIMERERFDGADVAHLMRARMEQLAWGRLLHRFEDTWRVLFAHLTLFGFIYPEDRARVPAWVMHELMGRLERELALPERDDHVCRGTILSRQQYLIDVQRWGYADARVAPRGQMTPEETAHWTAAIDKG